jgi:hypothetical protein
MVKRFAITHYLQALSIIGGGAIRLEEAQASPELKN